MKKILVLRPAPDLLPVIKDACAPGYVVESAASQAECLGAMAATNVDFVFIDIDLLADQRNHSAKNPWKEALKPFWQANPHTEIIVTTPQDRIRDAVNAVKAGAGNYLALPINSDELKYVLDSILDSKLMQSELDYLRDSFWSDESADIIRTKSAAMKEVFDKIRMVAPTNTTVLLSGEIGTGKGVLAKLIHSHSKRRPAQFISVHCGAIPDTLIESELFGHEKGAFTGAVKRKLGKFEIARGGTIFLDEIATVTPAVQIKLLQVLQDRTFQRVGGEAPIDADARIIAATNFDLKAMCEAKEFRNDLYYRLNVFPIELPPLRDRLEDIPLLVEIFLKRLNLLYSAEIVSLHPLVLEAFQEYRWPGNIRELENLVERAFILENSDTLTPESFPAELFVGLGRAPSVAMDTSLTLAETRRRSLDLIERKYLKEVLSEQNGRIGQTASMAGITPRQLHKLMKKYDLRKENFK